MDKDKQDFKVGEAQLTGKFKKCVLCENDFKLGEDIVLHPLQEPRKGFANVECIILHKNCYWIEDEAEGSEDVYVEEKETQLLKPTNETQISNQKGCGERFDKLGYGFVTCGEFYNNILRAGDDRKVFCSKCWNVEKNVEEKKDA